MSKVVAVTAILLAFPGISSAALIAEQPDNSSTHTFVTTNQIQAHAPSFTASQNYTLGSQVALQENGPVCTATAQGKLRFSANIPVGKNLSPYIFHDSATPTPHGVNHVLWSDLPTCSQYIPGNGVMTDYEMAVTLPVFGGGGLPDTGILSGNTYHVVFAETAGFYLEVEFKTDANNNIFYQLYDDATSTPATTTPPVCTENCNSSVVFLPGMKGSALSKEADTLWPPTFYSNDVAQLGLIESGGSVSDIQVDGILETFYGTDIYAPFSDFLDGLVEDETIHEWKSIAYDWRYMPDEILDNGIETPQGTLDVIAEIERIAADSRTGKVTIVAHSMGGLLGKAVIKRLQEEGRDNLIDSFVMVATPQLGTPQAAAVVLHGDDEGIGAGFVVDSSHARALARNMPSAYNLLPSPAYFGVVSDPAITFSDASFTQPWREFWGDSVNTYNEFEQFMTGLGVPRTRPLVDVTRVPEVAQSTLMDNAEAFHATYDTYTFPEHIRVVQVAGWGRPTVKSIDYDTKHFLQNYETKFTREGDRTVVYPSAISATGEENYFFNLFSYNNSLNVEIQHRDILSAASLQDLIKLILSEGVVENIKHLTNAKPSVADLDDELVVSTHSPVVLGVHDEHGNFTGIDPNQDLSAEVLAISENIPGSTFLYTSESQHIFLPKKGTYSFVYKGTGTGSTTVTIDSFVGDTVSPVSVFTDIPTLAGTKATFDVSASEPEDTLITVDINGDNVVDQTVYKDGTPLPLDALLAYLKEMILSLGAKEKLKQNLMKRVEAIEKKIEAKKVKNAKVIANLKNKIDALSLKGRIDAADAFEIVALAELLEAQSDTTVIDAEVLNQLKVKFEGLNIKTATKADLLKRITRLENKQALVNSVTRLSNAIERKGLNGKISDVDAQALISALEQLENTI